MTTKITIGIPVFNGEHVLKNKIKEILNQTYQNFTIIISDNASTDNTQKIGEEIAAKNKRISYFRHEKNKGGGWNFNFLLQKAKTEYFIWAAVDDIWCKKFLETNIDVLEKNEKIVGSIGEMKMFNRILDSKTNKEKIKILENSKKFQYVHPVKGNRSKKIEFCLNFNMGGIIYAVYRTKQLQKANTFYLFEKRPMWRCPLACILNIIKEGDLEVIDDVFVYKHTYEKSSSIIKYLRNSGFNFLEIGFINFPFTNWCLRNLGPNEFLKNLGYFIKLNIESEFGIIAEILRMGKRVISGQNKYW